METNWRALGLTTLAPVAWGSGYYVTATYLPADRPLFGALVRALPFGLLLLAIRPARPRGVWWWRVAVLGTLNIGAFFVLVFIAAYRLPGGTAATLTATAPILVMVLAWPLIGERPRVLAILGGLVGATGVALLVLRPGATVDPVGVAASLGAVAASSTGFVLVKRWRPPVDLITFTAWQLVAGGMMLLPVALLVEGRPPHLDLQAYAGFAWIGLSEPCSPTWSGSTGSGGSRRRPSRWSACSTRSRARSSALAWPESRSGPVKPQACCWS